MFLDFRHLRTSNSGAGTATESSEEDGTNGIKRKVQTSQVRKKKPINGQIWYN